HGTAPFTQIKTEDYIPAFQKAIQDTKNEIEAITSNTDIPTFENTLEALAYSGMELDVLSNIFFNLNSAETNDEMQKIAQEVAPMLSALSNDISLNEELFKRVKAVYEQKDSLNLTTEQETLLTKNYKSFVRNGALLSEDKKERLRAIDAELSTTALKFGENVLAETHKYQLHITSEKDLAGLPEGAVEEAKALAEQEAKEGWIFTLDYPSYIPFMTYADNRELRKEMAIAGGKKAFQDNEHNNEANVLNIVNLRHERANLLGYATHAHFVLEERMAQSPDKVNAFLEELLAKAKPAADKEFAELTAFAKKTDNIDQLEKWDGSYYSEKLKQERFSLDDELLKPYFQLENVLDGAYQVANKLYGLVFTEVHNIEKYHADVRTFEVTNEAGEFIAVFYTDFFPRKGKRNGAWMTSFKNQYIKDGINERPH
ncbi:MAG: M3 family metallopeptidase, partial [Flavobacterium sp.]